MVYRAVKDGCAITIRAFCLCFGLNLVAIDRRTGRVRPIPRTDRANPASSDVRREALLSCCMNVRFQESPVAAAFISGPKDHQQMCLLEVLFLANRCVAHPTDGDIDHEAGPEEMKSAINSIFGWLRASNFPGISEVFPSLLAPLP